MDLKHIPSRIRGLAGGDGFSVGLWGLRGGFLGFGLGERGSGEGCGYAANPSGRLDSMQTGECTRKDQAGVWYKQDNMAYAITMERKSMQVK